MGRVSCHIGTTKFPIILTNKGKITNVSYTSPDRDSMESATGQMEIIDIDGIVERTSEKWINYTLSKVNDSLIRLGIFEGEFHWHHHDREDEFFYVISGKLLLDLEDGTIELLPNHVFTVPRGVEHRTRAKEKTVVIMVEGDTVEPKGD